MNQNNKTQLYLTLIMLGIIGLAASTLNCEDDGISKTQARLYEKCVVSTQDAVQCSEILQPRQVTQ